MAVRYYGWVALRDPMFPRQVLRFFEIIVETLDELIAWWEEGEKSMSGTWNGQAVQIDESGQTFVREKIIGTPRERGGDDLFWTPVQAVKEIERLTAEVLTAENPHPDDDGLDDPDRALWGKVIEVGEQIAEDARRARARHIEAGNTTPETYGEPIARIQLHSRMPYASLVGDIPTNDASKGLMGFIPAEGVSKGKGVIVAVLDTGCNASHPCFRGATVMPVIDATGHGPVADSNGHGTFCVGQIVSQLPSGNPFGTARQVSIVPIRVLHPRDGWGSDSQIARGVLAAIQVGAQVVSMSLGGPDPMPQTADAIRVAIEKGITVVVAAGNDGPGPGDVSYPAKYANTISVGSVNLQKQLSRFSNRGPSLDVVACGEQQVGPTGTSGYGSWNGTSMATPHVAAAVAMYYAFAKSVTGEWPKPSVVMNDIARTASDRTTAWGGGRANVGILQADMALWEVRTPEPPTPEPEPPVIEVPVIEVPAAVADWMRLTAERFERGEDVVLCFRPKKKTA